MYRSDVSPRPSPVVSPVALGVAVALSAVTWLLWATTGLASTLSGHLTVIGLTGLGHLGASLASHLSDPAAAYDGALERDTPSAGLWWLSLAFVVMVTAAIAVGVAELYFRRTPSPSDAQWANRWDLRQLRMWRREPGRLVLGSVGRRLVSTEACHSVMVFGPTGSMKTTGLVIPSILEWDGPVLSTRSSPTSSRPPTKRDEEAVALGLRPNEAVEDA